MEPTITTLTAFGQARLERHPAGTVHSVYRKTVNLCLGGQLLALQAAGSPLSPISLLTDLEEAALAALPLAMGDPVRLVGDILQVGGFRFSLRGAAVRSLALSPARPEDLTELAARLQQALAQRRPGGLEPLLLSDAPFAEEPLFLTAARRRLEGVGRALLASDWPGAAAGLGGLVGLGPGLTPSGDDFLCGMLAGLLLAGLWQHPFATCLMRQIASRLPDTNAISAAFLQCALEGQYSEAVVQLSTLPPVEEILTAFSAIGHSSGSDTLCGVLYLLERRGALLAG